MAFEPIYLNGRQDNPPARQETGAGKRAAYQYDNGYRESARLPNGLEVIFRTVRQDDKELLSEGVARLSPTSRFNRFVSDRNSLSERELEYLTEIDGINHFAIGAVRLLPEGIEQGIGAARFVRLDDDPGIAEPAVTVVDEWQGRGVGTGLLRRLVEAARERGITKFQCDFLADNRKAYGLLDGFEKVATLRTDNYGVVTMEFPLPPPRPNEHPRTTLKRSSMYRAMSRVARGVLFQQNPHHRKISQERIPAAGRATLALLEPIQPEMNEDSRACPRGDLHRQCLTRWLKYEP